MNQVSTPDAEPNERCPRCGHEVDDVEQRGDITAYIHVQQHRNDCLT